jgi:hypothetical protein
VSGPCFSVNTDAPAQHRWLAVGDSPLLEPRSTAIKGSQAIVVLAVT